MYQLLTSSDCFKKYGAPELEKNMVLWDVPSEMEIGVIPKRIYCNKDMQIPLLLAFKALISTGKKRGVSYENIKIQRGKHMGKYQCCLSCIV
jgi:hypothetical protein